MGNRSEAWLAEYEKKRAGVAAPAPVEPPKKRNKMGNVEVVIDGHKFQSTKEGSYWQTLQSRAAAGQITQLRKQYPIGVTIDGEHICTLIVDFRFMEKGVWRYQDVKGRKKGVQYQLFKLKQKLVLACNGITVEEI